MNENRCICCYGPAPKSRSLCQDCQERIKDIPTEMEVLLWRPFPLIEPKITNKEYLVTIEGEGVDVLWWDGFDWISTDDYFSITDRVIAWTTVPSPYKPREEKSDG